MKKIFMIAVMALATLTVSAQDKPFAVGINASYGLNKDYKNFGVGAKFQYSFVESFRAEASGNYFFKKDYMKMWDANVNLHYLIPIGESLKVYPFVGVTVLGAKVDASGAGLGNFSGSLTDYLHSLGYSDSQINDMKTYAAAEYAQLEAAYNNAKGSIADSSSETKFGFNAGVGIEYYLSESFKINFEAKYQYVKNYDRPVLSIGAAYCF